MVEEVKDFQIVIEVGDDKARVVEGKTDIMNKEYYSGKRLYAFMIWDNKVCIESDRGNRPYHKEVTRFWHQIKDELTRGKLPDALREVVEKGWLC